MWSTGEDPARVVVEVEVTDGPLAAEVLADRLLGLGSSAVGERPGDDGVVVLTADLDPVALAALADLGVAHRTVVPDPSWRTAWRDGAEEVRAGRLVVRPPWVPPGARDADTVEVVVDPGDAFGSGAHPTTLGCLAEVEALVAPGARVLDVGSGSGVLGVAALVLGAGAVVAVDTDPEARRVTTEVAATNGVADRLEVSDSLPDPGRGPFDLVLANLLVPVVEELGPALRRSVAPGGWLVVGGVLGGQVDRVVAAVGLDPVRVGPAPGQGPDGWTTVVFAGADASPADGVSPRP